MIDLFHGGDYGFIHHIKCLYKNGKLHERSCQRANKKDLMGGLKNQVYALKN